MAYCHECGSEVAPIDVFCPYCGILLTQTPAEEEKNENIETDSSTQTQPENADFAESKPAESSHLADTEDDFGLDKILPLPVSDTETVNDAKPVTTVPDDFATSVTEENINLNSVSDELNLGFNAQNSETEQNVPKIDEVEEKIISPGDDFSPDSESENAVETPKVEENNLETPSFEDIPTPSLINDAPDVESSVDIAEDKTNEPEVLAQIPEKEEVNENISEPLPVESAAPENEKSVVEDIFQDSFASFELPVNKNIENEQIAEPPAESEIKTPLESTETPVEEIHPKEYFAENKDPFNETMPNMSAAFEKNDETVVENTSEFSSDVPTTQETEKNVEVNKEETESEMSPVSKISMPSEDLVIPDPLESQSVFDSVRIMENKPLPNENKAEEQPSSSFVAPIGETSLPENVFAEAVKQEEPKESRSYTTPIAGSNDTDGKKAAKLKPLDEGTILNGRYEIIRKIGGGGMGAVYLASDNNLGGVLRAVKEMVQSYIEEAQQDKAINDFKRESTILSTLDHPSIPTIYDYFYDDKESRFYLVMKYISGGDLSSRIRATPEGKLDELTVTDWAIQVADVLNYLHSQPTTIVYRDLKPSNLMIDGNSNRVMLIDFGIARSVNKEEKGVTAVGTMGYAPPELFSGNVEPRSDIYSLGSTMFHLLTGADPQSNPLLIFDFQKNPRPRQINSQLSDQIERILMRAVEYNASARFTSAAELKQVLEEHLANLKANRVSFGVKETPVTIGLQDQPVFCGFCGQKIMATDMFCAFCGSKQPLSQKGVHSEIYSHTPVTAKLMLLGTNELDSPVFSIEKDENLIGRRDPMSNIFPEVDLSKYDPQTKISRRHARIWRDGNNFLVEDLGSSNGTVVIPSLKDLTRLLPHQPHVLANGDKIRVGDTTLHFVIR